MQVNVVFFQFQSKFSYLIYSIISSLNKQPVNSILSISVGTLDMYYRIYLRISQTIFSEIWICIDQKHSQQRGSAYSREFDLDKMKLLINELL